MYFSTKSYLKSNHYHTVKHSRNHPKFDVEWSIEAGDVLEFQKQWRLVG